MVSLDQIEELLPGCRRYQSYLAGLCPFHTDSTPSLMVYEDGYTCLACGERGRLENLLQTLRGLPPIAPQHHGRLPWHRWLADLDIEGFALRAHKYLTSHPEQGCYLKSRGIEDMTKKLVLGFMEGYYTFPIFDRARNIVGLVVRAGSERQKASQMRYLTPPDQTPQVYVPSYKRIDRYPMIYFPFGIIDAITLYKLGYPVMTWSIGKHVPAEALDPFRKRIIFLPDQGEEQDANRTAAALGWRGRVKRIEYPLGAKDPNDLYRMGAFTNDTILA